MCSVISASKSSWISRSTISLRKEGSSSKISCAIRISTLRWSVVIVAPFRLVDFEHQPSWRTMTLLSSQPLNYRSLRTQPTRLDSILIASFEYCVWRLAFSSHRLRRDSKFGYSHGFDEPRRRSISLSLPPDEQSEFTTSYLKHTMETVMSS